MIFFKRLLDILINTSIYVGLAVYALWRITEIELKLLPNNQLGCFVFFGTVLGYNFLRYFDFSFNKSLTVLKQNTDLVIVNIIAVVGAAYFFSQFNYQLQVYFLGLLGIVLLYPFIRKFGVVKIIVVSFCVTAITAYVPALTLKAITTDVYLLVLQRFIMVICLLIPVEILDLKTDDKSLKTLPQKIGVRNTKIVGLLLLSFFVGLEFFKTSFSFVSLFIAVNTALFILFSSVNRSKYYTSFWVESIPILWYGLLVFL